MTDDVELVSIARAAIEILRTERPLTQNFREDAADVFEQLLWDRELNSNNAQ